MSDAKQDDELTAEESQALLNSLNARAASGAAPAAAEDGPDEDLEAYLASLEADDAPAAKPAQGAAQAASKPAEPDPFADAFSQLEAEHGHAVVAPPPREIKAPEKTPAKAPAAKAPEKTPEKAPEEPAAKKPAPDKKPEAAKSRVHAVEKVRSRQFILVTGALKLALLLAPALLTWWIAGALLSRWVGTGWIIAVVATLIAFVPGIALRLGTHKGRVLWWSCGLGVLLSAAALAGVPQHTGQALIRYGHWPSSTVAQLAQWDADHLVVRGHASASALAGEQVLKIRADQAAPAAPAAAPNTAPDAAKPAALVPLALGTERDLKAFADEARKKAAEAAPKPADPAKPAEPAPAKPAEAPAADAKPAEAPVEAAKPAEAPAAPPAATP